MTIIIELSVPLRVELNEAGGLARVEGIEASKLQLAILSRVMLQLQTKLEQTEA